MRVEFDEKAKLTDILEKIENSPEDKLELALSEGSPALESPINKEIIERFAKEKGKTVELISSELVGPADELGFVEGEDVAMTLPSSPAEVAAPLIATEVNGEKKSSFVKFRLNLSGLRRIPKIYLFGTSLIILLLIALYAIFWVIPSASIVLTYSGSSKEASSEVQASVGSELDTDENVVPAEMAQVTKSDLATAKTTGKKNIGDSAKGRITINNYSTSNEPVFLAGVVVTSTSGGVTFTIDSDVSAAKATSPGTPGKTGVNVTATKTGPEGNLAAGTLFKVGSISDLGYISATNDTAFAGGSTKTISVVAEADRKALRDQLLDSLTKKATDEIQKQGEGLVIPDGSVEVTVTKETYDAELGAEAEKLSLSLEVTASSVVVKQDDLVKVLTKNMIVPDGFKVDETSSAASATFVSKTDTSTYTLQGKIRALLLPSINLSSLSKKLAGKKLSDAKEQLNSLNGIDSYSLKFEPTFYSKIGFLPFSSDKIHIKLEKSK